MAGVMLTQFIEFSHADGVIVLGPAGIANPFLKLNKNLLQLAASGTVTEIAEIAHSVLMLRKIT